MMTELMKPCVHWADYSRSDPKGDVRRASAALGKPAIALMVSQDVREALEAHPDYLDTVAHRPRGTTVETDDFRVVVDTVSVSLSDWLGLHVHVVSALPQYAGRALAVAFNDQDRVVIPEEARV